jgi:hypothetical protein
LQTSREEATQSSESVTSPLISDKGLTIFWPSEPLDPAQQNAKFERAMIQERAAPGLRALGGKAATGRCGQRADGAAAMTRSIKFTPDSFDQPDELFEAARAPVGDHGLCTG